MWSHLCHSSWLLLQSPTASWILLPHVSEKTLLINEILFVCNSKTWANKNRRIWIEIPTERFWVARHLKGPSNPCVSGSASLNWRGFKRRTKITNGAPNVITVVFDIEELHRKQGICTPNHQTIAMSKALEWYNNQLIVATDCWQLLSTLLHTPLP